MGEIVPRSSVWDRRPWWQWKHDIPFCSRETGNASDG